MTINYESTASENLDFDSDEPSSDFDNSVAEFELDTSPVETNKKSRQSAKRNFLAKKKIEQLQEERQLRKFEEDYYDDWD